MDDEKLKKIAQQTDPANMGVALEKQKEAAVEANKDSLEKSPLADMKQRKVGIRTYRDYAARELKKGGGTLTKMIVKEREKEREQKRHSVKNTKNIAVSFLAVLFILAGLGIVALSFVLVQMNQRAAEERNSFIVAPEPLVVADFRKEIYIKTPNRTKINRAVVDEIDATSIPIGSIKHIYIVQDSTQSIKELISTQDFFDAMGAQVPRTLGRALEDRFMYGVYSSTDISPFLIFKATSFSIAYAGLLEWERDMVSDLEDVFVKDLSNTSRSSFQDVVLYNTDVRVLLDDEGGVLFGYGFLQDKETLVFFDNRLALREIITRNQRNIIRE